MTTHSSVLAWRIPEMAGPGGLPSMGSHRVGHDLAAAEQSPCCLRANRVQSILPIDSVCGSDRASNKRVTSVVLRKP